MKVVVQRVSRASVTVDGETVSSIGRGLLLLVGVARGDTRAQADWLAEKISGLRIFEDAAGRMNLSVRDVGGEILAVSQFTLLADTRKGKRPSFVNAAPPGEAEPLFDYFCGRLREKGLRVGTGVFGAMMEVGLVNSGPVTVILER
ncbi:D-tyrosyl-tRNA(Tyr) deacylase [Rubrobacter taiwanensis]|jgi:D-tyrosyl-tRNA(Tyr) deacylase|uniref:D-aminoacyl-tRNA deacylase n=1 Tax=Rubrobacter taiwanensis TaxID=185139 RepID=A0A4R1BNJ1_9ACTN|nr:D-aminoacyl-tRNA deacylase [Rubrobacter taiwanensis]TCJ18856.1 D-tyrosyl-tRNA(Tyr) deacylase [Rubrobacter taiwanensis]